MPVTAAMIGVWPSGPPCRLSLGDTAVRRTLLALASAVIATNLFLVVEMNFPYYDAYRAVVAALS
ncbi:hypothetical protein [Dactylosporangium sp. NPDC049140]|uniref:hypothetical protein n=1 Tax=Dactylosporangium sp. NPDC049140 TaxID=3155647 RepID=UPI003406F62B